MNSIGLATILLLIGADPAPKFPNGEFHAEERDRENYPTALVQLAKILPEQHAKPRKLDAEVTDRWFDLFLHQIDPQRLVFTQEQVKEFAKLKADLPDHALAGDLTLADEVYKKYNQQCVQLTKISLGWLEAKHDFSVDETFALIPRESPADADALADRWRKKVKYDLLCLRADGHSEAEAKELLQRRYSKISAGGRFPRDLDVYDALLDSFAKAFSPHDQYMPERELARYRW